MHHLVILSITSHPVSSRARPFSPSLPHPIVQFHRRSARFCPTLFFFCVFCFPIILPILVGLIPLFRLVFGVINFFRIRQRKKPKRGIGGRRGKERKREKRDATPKPNKRNNPTEIESIHTTKGYNTKQTSNRRVRYYTTGESTLSSRVRGQPMVVKTSFTLNGSSKFKGDGDGRSRPDEDVT